MRHCVTYLKSHLKQHLGPHLKPLTLWLFAGLLLLVLDATVPDFLIYDRCMVLVGEWYRLFTCHFVHFTPMHLLLNWLGLLLVSSLIADRERWPLQLAVLPGMCAFIGVGLLLFAPELGRYGGFSGVLHGLLVWACLRQYLAGGRQVVWLLLTALVILKVGYEQTPWYDPTAMQATIGVPVATMAHLLGVVAGVLVGLLSGFAGFQAQRCGKQGDPAA